MSYNLKVEENALTEAPCWENHRRGKNWCAEISKNPGKPGGLERIFWERARGTYLYHMPTDLEVGVPLEFGADYYTIAGSPKRTRIYGVVTAVAPDCITFETYPTAVQAIKAGEALTASLILENTTDSDELFAAKQAAESLSLDDLGRLIAHAKTLHVGRSVQPNEDLLALGM